jgi:hypothetical protein
VALKVAGQLWLRRGKPAGSLRRVALKVAGQLWLRRGKLAGSPESCGAGPDFTLRMCGNLAPCARYGATLHWETRGVHCEEIAEIHHIVATHPDLAVFNMNVLVRANPSAETALTRSRHQPPRDKQEGPAVKKRHAISLCLISQAVLLTAVACGPLPSCAAAEVAGSGAEGSVLCRYPLHAVDTQAVLRLVTSIVDQQRVMLIPGTRELAVFAPRSVQQSVANAIVAHESQVLLLEVIELNGADPQQTREAIGKALGGAAARDAGEPRVELDTTNQRLYVWARKPQVDRIRKIVAGLALSNQARSISPEARRGFGTDSSQSEDGQPSPDRGIPPRQPQRPGPVVVEQLLGPGKEQDQREATERQPLLLPTGPVQIEHVEGTDLLLIRARGDGHGLLVPSGPVQIEHIEGTDILLLKGSRSDLKRLSNPGGKPTQPAKSPDPAPQK